jgi:2-polyprenyl-3-methyl-5-hydroxy-6-metoxy-1,4-benzoquinol methylase
VPTSNLHVIPSVVHLVHTVPHERVLDVGPGAGKFGVLLREALNDPPRFLDAVEAHAPYVARYRLACIYDDVVVADIRDEMLADRLRAYDVVLMVDVIEHLPLDDGLDLLARIPGRIVLSTPVDFFENPPGGPPSEEHRSHWTGEVIEAVGRSRPLEHWTREHGQHLVRLGPLP